jgi:nucleotide-binding universal stress UspA family protein
MKMLVCSDGSEQAERAMRLGAAIAAGCRAEVTLLGIIEAPGRAPALLESLQRGQSLLEEKNIRAELITKSGKPIPEIMHRDEEAHYDLVVIGAVRKTARGFFWMSSKSYQIIKKIKPPVLLVTGHGETVKKMLICSGGRYYNGHAVRLAGEISRGLGAAVVLLHVLPPAPAMYAHLRRMHETPAALLESPSEVGRNLRRAKETLEAFGVPVEVRLRYGSVVVEILGEIHEGGCDLVVAGSALDRSLRTYVLGDLSREIVNRAGCPVLVVRPGKTA